MNIVELMKELERKFKIIKAKGVRPEDVSVRIPTVAEDEVVWEEVEDSDLKWSDGMLGLYLLPPS